jgi:PAS domain S-box-containing protein
MKRKTKEDLLQEIERLQRRIAELEAKGGAPDITEHKKAKEALASSEQFLNNVIEQGPVSLWISDSEGTLIKMNQACRELFGVTDEEAVGKYNLFLDNLIEEQGFMPLVENAFEKGEIARFTIDYDLPRVEHIEVKKGTHRILDVVVSPIKDIHGKLTNALVQHKDITDRKRIEAELTVMQRLYRELFENVNIGILRTTPGPEGTFVDINPAMVKLFEADSREQLMALHPSEIYWDASQRKIISDDIVAKGFAKEEIRFKTLKGNPLWCQINSVKKTGASDQVYFDSTIEDITDRKRAEKELQAANQQLAASNQQLRATEQQLRASNQQLKAGMERLAEAQAIARLGSWEYDAEKDVISGSDEFHRLFGVGHDRLRTYQAFIDLLHPDDREHVGRDVQESLTKKALYDTEYRVRLPNGDYRDIHARGRVFADEAGKPVRMVGTCLDITERRRAEVEILESNATIRSLVDATPESLFLMDPDGTVRAANEIVAKRLGRTVEEIEGQSIWETLPPEVTRSRKPLIEAIIRSGKPDRFEDKRGDSFIDNIVHPVLNEQGQVSRVAILGVDITERKRAEEALRESESKFKRLYDSNIIGVIFWDTAGNIIQANGEFLRIVGYTEDDVLSGRARWKDMTPPKYAYLDEKAIKEMTETGISAPFEKEYIRKDGSRVPIRLNAALLKGERDIGICFIQDITERKRAEEALKESERRFRALFDNTPDGIVLADPENKKFTMGNETFYQMLGYNSDEIQNLGVMDIHPAEEVNHSADQFEKLLRKEIAVAENIPIKRKDGSIFFADIRAFLVSLAGKTYLAGVFRDITERRRVEDALKISKDRLLFATEGANLGVWNWNTVTGELIWSDKCKALFGIRPDETMSYQRFRDALHPDDRERTDKAVQDALDNHTDYDIEYRSLWPDGSIHWLAAKGRGYYDATGKAVRLEGVVLDIATRKRDEEALKQKTADLERSNKELEQFAYVASHDLQEPLRMVSSYTQLLAQRYEGQLDDKAKKYIDYAVDGALRMQRLINDLLTYSRVGTRGKPLEPTDSHSVLGEALLNLQSAVEESRAIITNDDLPTVRVDASQLAQVFQNLIANAIKFRGETPQRIHVSALDRGREWVFSISDNGIGIDPQYKDRVFMIFQRLHTKQEYPGTGIGLALCKRIVERHGGRIWFESEPGKGSTFFFAIPK